MISKPTRRLLLALILVVGAVLRFSSLRFGLPHPFARPDEEHISQAAAHILGGDFDPHFFLYPSLFIYADAAGYSILSTLGRALGAGAAWANQGLGQEAALRLVARELSALCGVLTIAALYEAASEIVSRRAALASAAFLAVAFLHVRDSHFGVTDVAATLMTVCAFWAALRIAARGLTTVRAAAVGVLSGLAASTKYNAIIVVLPALAAIGLQVVKSSAVDIRSAVKAAAIVSVCAGLAFLAATPFALLDRPTFDKDFTEQSEVARGVDQSTILADARQVLGERGWLHHATFTLPYGLGVPLLFASLAGAVWLACSRPDSAVLVLSFPFVFYLVMGSNALAYARWMVPIVPFLCLTAGELVDGLARRAGTMFHAPLASDVVAMTVVLLIAAPTAAESIAFDGLVARTDSRLLAARWIEDRYPDGAVLYETGRAYGQVEPDPPDRYRRCDFSERRRRFECADPSKAASTLPDLVVVLESPLAIFTRVPDTLGAVLDLKYEPIASFQGISSAVPPAALYDTQDAFFVPFAGIAQARRPGPSIRIFQRRSP